MYEMRFGEAIKPGLPIQTVRGKEGYRVREAHRKVSELQALVPRFPIEEIQVGVQPLVQ